jgi:hypothetical protein
MDSIGLRIVGGFDKVAEKTACEKILAQNPAAQTCDRPPRYRHEPEFDRAAPLYPLFMKRLKDRDFMSAMRQSGR